MDEIILELLSNKDAIVNMIGLTIIIDMKIDYESIIYIYQPIIKIVERSLKSKLFNKLLNFYIENKQNRKSENIPKCLFMFIENGIYIYIFIYF